MKKIVSGMILVTREYGDLHYSIDTPVGLRVIDVNGECIEFDEENYKKAYVPKDYNDPWVPNNETVVMF